MDATRHAQLDKLGPKFKIDLHAVAMKHALTADDVVNHMVTGEPFASTAALEDAQALDAKYPGCFAALAATWPKREAKAVAVVDQPPPDESVFDL